MLLYIIFVELYQLKCLETATMCQLIKGMCSYFSSENSNILEISCDDEHPFVTKMWLLKLWNYLCQQDHKKLHLLEGLFIVPLSWNEPMQIVRLEMPSTVFYTNTDIDENLLDTVRILLNHFDCVITNAMPIEVKNHIEVMNNYIQVFTAENVVSTIVTICQLKDDRLPFKDITLKICGKGLEELRGFLAGKKNYSKEQKTVMQQVPIFKTYNKQIVSADHHSAAPLDAKLPLDLMKLNLIDLSLPDSKALANKLDIEVLTIPQLITTLLPRILEYETEIADQIAIYIITRCDEFWEDVAFSTMISQTAFIKNNSGKVVAPVDLFDPSIDLLQKLFYDEVRFPCDAYQSDMILARLRAMGMKGVKDVDPDDVLHAAQTVDTMFQARVESSGDKTLEVITSKSISILEILNSKPSLLEHVVDRCTLSEHLLNICWLPTLGKPGDNYPSSLPFYDSPSFVKPTTAFCSTDILLVGSNSSIMNFSMIPMVMQHLHLPNEITLTNLVLHLGLVIEHYNYTEKAQYLVVLTDVYNKLFNCYKPCDILEQLANLDIKQWLWNGNGFCEPQQITVEPTFTDMTPYIWPLQAELSAYKQVLVLLRVIEKCDQHILIDVLHQLAHSSIINSDSRKLELAVVLINKLSEYEEQIDFTGVPLPIQTSNDGYTTKEMQDCTYCDTEWLRQKDNHFDHDNNCDEVHFIHQNLSMNVAKKIGVRTLLDRIAVVDEFAVTGFGQQESLTNRLHGLVQEYTDGFSVFKELVQNADDAGAQNVVFIYDERKNEQNKQFLLNENMKSCQGPALWAYNDAYFTDDDFINISKLGSGSKSKDCRKIGKFGLGFNSVYNLTDVPSILSREFLVILDPHMTHLTRSLTKGQPGMKMNLKKNNALVKRVYDQFHPYTGILGCDFTEHDFNFDGTLMRLPLRTPVEAEQSEISDKWYSKMEMIKLLRMLKEGLDVMILFTSNVKSVKFFHIPEEVNHPSNMVELLTLSKKNVQNLHNSTASSVEELKMKAEKHTPLTDSFINTDSRLVHSNIISIEKCTTVACSRLIDDTDGPLEPLHAHNSWLISSATGSTESFAFAALHPQEAYLPIASVAISIQLDSDQRITVQPIRGRLFCYLPLAIETALPIHVNASFSLQSNRRNLITQTSDDKVLVGAEWNKILLSDVVCQAYMHALRTVFIFPTITKHIFDIWPRSEFLNETDVHDEIVRCFYKSVVSSKEIALYRCPDGHDIYLKDAVFLHETLQNSEIVGNLCKQIFVDAFPHNYVNDMPIEIVRIMRTVDTCHFIDEKVYSCFKFYHEVIFPRIDRFDCNDWDQLILFVLENSNEDLDRLLKQTAIVPVSGETEQPQNCIVKRPSELFDPRDKLLDTLFLGEDVFPSTPYRPEAVLECLTKLGMKGRCDVNACDLVRTAQYIESQYKQNYNVCHVVMLSTKSLSILATLHEQPHILNSVIEEKTLMEWLKHISWLPALTERVAHYPKSLPFCGDDQFVKPVDSYLADNALLVSSHYPVCEVSVSTTVEECLGLHRRIPLSTLLRQLSMVIEHYVSSEKACYLVSIVQIYNTLFREYAAVDIVKEITLMGIKHWIWNGDGFSKPQHIVVEKPFADLQPYVWMLQPEVSSHKDVLLECGINRACSADILKGVLHELNTNSHEKYITDSDKIKLSVAILNELSCLDLTIDLAGVPMPIDTCHSVYATKCWEDCTYCDTKWLQQGHSEFDVEETIYFLHPMISMETAKALSVTPLINRILHSDEFCTSEFGQQEVLTDRLRGLLKEYTDGFAIFKELLQNADDAGAKEVVFIYDERHNAEHMDFVFGTNMRHCQGPSLWAFNDAKFSDDDFINISKLGAGSKCKDHNKIGKFGLGFNSVYNITDLPSIVSREYLVIFDPHRNHLDQLGTEKKKPGIKINLKHNTTLVKRFYDQFYPYMNMMGCDFTKAADFFLDGTLIRLPFRSAIEAEKSEISQLCYNRAEILKLLDVFVDSADDLLLFVNNVKSVKLLHINENETNPEKAVEMISLLKGLVKDEIHTSTVYSHTDLMSKVQQLRYLDYNISNPLVYNEVVLLKTHISAEFPTIMKQNNKKVGTVCMHWMISHTAGISSSLQMSTQYPNETFTPVAGIAAQIQLSSNGKIDTVAVDGKLFCYLPLAVMTGLHVHINAPFCMQSNRRNIVTQTTDDKMILGAVWNETIMADAVCHSYVILLRTLFTFSQHDEHFFHVWPIVSESCRVDSAFMGKFIEHFFNCISHQEQLPLCRFQRNIIYLEDALFLHTELQTNQSIGPDCRLLFQQVLPKRAVLDIPEQVLKALSRVSNAKSSEETVLSLFLFVKNIVIRHFDQIDVPVRNKLILYALAHADAALESLLREKACIPVSSDSLIVQIPANVFDPDVSLLRRLFYGELMFPTAEFQSEIILKCLRNMGMKQIDDVSANLILHVATYVHTSSDTVRDACKLDTVRQKADAIIEMIKINPELLRHKVGECTLRERLLKLKWLPTINQHIRDYPTDLPFYTSPPFVIPSSAYSIDKLYAIGSNSSFISSASCTVMENTFNIHNKLPLGKLLLHLKEVVQHYNTAEKTIYTVVVLSIYKEMFGCYDASEIIEELLSIELDDWIWNGNGFCKPCQITVVRDLLDLTPYVWFMPVELYVYEDSLKQCGIIHQYHPDIYVKILHLLADTVMVTTHERKLEISVAILNKLCDGQLIPDLTGVPMPIQTNDSAYVTELWENCTYCDVEWYQQSHERDTSNSDIKFIHPHISLSNAESLNVCPLINRTLTIEDDGLIDFGQQESLTRRLNGLLKEYTDGFAIFKELIQNADDAGASEVVFIYDERQNEQYMSSLLHENMKLWQGPALWVYNDACFTKDDYKNLSHLGSSSKATDVRKIGKFGLGFNAVYNLTDVPSILSNEFMVILDPHKSHLGKAHRHGSQPGIMINLGKTTRNDRSRDQFEPFENVMGCDLSQRCFNGTLFRLPLRTEVSAKSSEISSTCYDSSEMVELLLKFKSGMKNLLLFTSSVCTVKLLHLTSTEQDPSNAKELCCFTKCTRNVLYTTIASSKAQLIVKIQDEMASARSCNRTYSNPVYRSLICLKETFSDNMSPLLSNDNSSIGSSSCYLVSYAGGVDKSLLFAITHANQSVLPYGAVAIQVSLDDDGKLIPCRTEGQLFCHLPLPVLTGLPVHINAPFGLQSNRRNILTQTSDDKLLLLAEWNKSLLVDAVCQAYLDSIKALHTMAADNINAFEIWPVSNHESLNIFSDLIDPFYKTLVTIPTFPLSHRNYVSIQIQNAMFLDKELHDDNVVGKICKELFYRVFPMKAVLNIPYSILDKLCGADRTLKANKIFGTYRFYSEIILNRLDKLEEQLRNDLMVYALLNLYDTLEDLLQCYAYIPVSGGKVLKCPGDLIHPRSCISKLFDASDHRLPEKPFTRDCVLLCLVKLGMQKDSLRWKDIFNRATTISQLDESNISERQEHLLSYLEIKLQDSADKDSAIQDYQDKFATVAFLSVLTKSNGECMPWKGDCSGSLHSPNELYSFGFKDLCSVNRSIHKYSIAIEVEKFLGINTSVCPYDVLHQLDCMIELQTDDREVTHQIECIYAYFNCLCGKEPKIAHDIVSKLKSMNCLLVNRTFVSLNVVALCCEYKQFEPWLYELPPYLQKYGELLSSLGVKQNFDLKDLVTTLGRIRQNFHRDLDEKTEYTCLLLLQEVVRIMKTNKISSIPEEYGPLYVPDTKLVLAQHTELLFNNSLVDTTIYNLNRFTHQSISQELAEKLNITMFRSHLTQDLSDGIPFGQSEPLTNILKRILMNYPTKEIPKELIQNSDDAGASHIKFIHDISYHDDNNVFSESWKQLQGPALCIYSNAEFTKEDIANIQRLGDTSKKMDPGKIGQYGIGFNSVYHLTDVPTIITYSEDNVGSLCIFDPNLKYIHEATEAKPGRLFDGPRLEYILDEFRDVKDAHLLNIGELTNFSTSYSIFRLPFRTRSMALASEISKQCTTAAEVNSMFDNIEENSFELLLFARSLKEISLHLLENDLIKCYSATSNIVEKDLVKYDEFTRNAKRISRKLKEKSIKLNDIDRSTVQYSKILSDNKGGREEWLICESMGFSDDECVPATLLSAHENDELFLMPTGSVAVLLERTRYNVVKEHDRGQRAFCFLPLPIETGLPVQVNGHFSMMYDNRQVLSSTGIQGTWNRILYQHILAPLYCQLIVEMTHTLDNFVNSQHLLSQVKHILKLFPSFRNSQWDVLVQAFYHNLSENKALMIPAKIISRTYDLRIEWMSTTGDDSVFFTGVPSSIDDIHDVLLECGLRIAFVPDTLQADILKANIDVKIISPAAVIQFFKSFSDEHDFCNKQGLPVPLHYSLFKNKETYCKVLRYCMCDSSFFDKLDGLPLLLTADSQLRKFSSKYPVYVSKYFNLFPMNLHRFVHNDVLQIAFVRHCSRGAFGGYSLTNIPGVKQMGVSELAKLLIETGETGETTILSSHVNNSFSWSNKQREWLQLLWQFIMEENGHYFSYNTCNIQGWCVIPVVMKYSYFLRQFTTQKAVIDTQYRSYSTTHYKKPYKHTKKVMNPVNDHDIATILGKLDICILDWSHLNGLGGIISEHISKLHMVATLYDRPSVLQIIYPHIVVSKLSNSEGEQVLRYFNDDIHSLSDKQISMLTELPCYVTVHGCQISLTNCCVYVIPSNVPKDDMDVWRSTRNVVFLQKDDRLHALYTRLGCKFMSVVDIYGDFILNSMHFEMLTMCGQMIHMKFLYDNYFNYHCCDMGHRELLLELCRELYFISEESSDEKHQAREFLDPDNILFKHFCPEKLPPKPLGGFSDYEWHNLLRQLGMQTKTTFNMFIQFAQMVARDSMTRAPFKGKILIERLFQERDPVDNTSLYTTISSIKFLCCTVVSAELSNVCKQHQRYLNEPLPKICCHGSVLSKDASLCWTNTTILPEWFPCNLDDGYLSCLGIELKPNPDLVVAHMKNVVEQLNADFGAYTDTLFTVFKDIYDFMQNNDINFNAVGKMPFVIIPQHKVVMPAHSIVVDLPLSDEIHPHLYKVPHELQEFSELFKQAGSTENVTRSQYISLLHDIYISSHGNKLNPNEIQQVYKAIRCFLHAVEERSGDATPMCLLNQRGIMCEANSITYNNVSAFISRISHSSVVNLMVDLKFSGVMHNNFEAIVSTLPALWRPQMASDVITEELMSEVDMHDQCESIDTLAGRLKSNGFAEGVARVIRHKCFHENIVLSNADIASAIENLKNIKVCMTAYPVYIYYI